MLKIILEITHHFLYAVAVLVAAGSALFIIWGLLNSESGDSSAAFSLNPIMLFFALMVSLCLPASIGVLVIRNSLQKLDSEGEKISTKISVIITLLLVIGLVVLPYLFFIFTILSEQISVYR